MSNFEPWKQMTREGDCRKVAELRIPLCSLEPTRKRLSVTWLLSNENERKPTANSSNEGALDG